MSRQTPLVAIVDDEESVRRALRRLVRSAQFDAEVFPSGDEFLETVSDHRPDCVVLDLHMPKVDGFQVQSWLARANIRIPIIVITGQDTSESHARVMDAGAVAYLQKPVDGDALLDAIASATGKKKSGGPQNPG